MTCADREADDRLTTSPLRRVSSYTHRDVIQETVEDATCFLVRRHPAFRLSDNLLRRRRHRGVGVARVAASLSQLCRIIGFCYCGTPVCVLPLSCGQKLSPSRFCGLDNEAETFLGLDFAFCGSVRIGSEERMKVGF